MKLLLTLLAGAAIVYAIKQNKNVYVTTNHKLSPAELEAQVREMFTSGWNDAKRRGGISFH